MKKIIILLFLPLTLFGQSPVLDSFKKTVSKIENNLKKSEGILTSQEFGSSPTGFIYYKLKFDLESVRYDVVKTESIVSPYSGYIIVTLKVQTNAINGDVLGYAGKIGFSIKDSASLNSNYGACYQGKGTAEKWCTGDIKINYAFQEGKWVYKNIETEIENRIPNGTTRGDIDRGVLDKLVNIK